MDRLRLKELLYKLYKQPTQRDKKKMLYMWIKQEHISFSEFEQLIDFIHHD